MKNICLPGNIARLLLIIICTILFKTANAQPAITSFSPTSGVIGSTVTITGNNFNTIPGNNIVYFGAVRATITTSTVSALTVTVPTGATYTPISVTTGGLTGYSSLPFVVTSPGGGGTAFQQGSFSSPLTFIAGSNPSTIFTSDVDGDGKPDMVSINLASNTLSVYRNSSTSGNLSFSPKVDFATGSYPEMVIMADVDGDSKPDAVVPNYGSGTVSVFRNISTPGLITFAPKVDFIVGAGPLDAVIGDVDGDGKPDIVVTNNTSNTVSLLKNTTVNSIISFAAKIDLPTGNNPQNAILSDLDGDRKPEIAVIDGGNNVSIYKNSSTINTISFASKIDFFCGNTPNYIAAGDMDSDGKSELVIASNAAVTVLQNTSSVGSLSFDRRDFSTGSTNFIVSIGDIDGDSKPDLAVTSYVSGRVALMRNTSTTGTIIFETALNFTTGSNPFGNALCDFDGDGLSDLAVANYGGNNISVRRNTTSNPNSPNITSFSPASVGTGTEVTITGTNLSGTTGVSFGGIPAISFTVVSATTIKAIVSNGASGNVQIVTPYGSAGLGGFVYTVLPTISSFDPLTGGQGSVITISGTNYLGTTNVSFGGVAASSFDILSPTIIKAVVDTGATGFVSVTNSYGTATKSGFAFNKLPKITSFTPQKGGTGTEVTIIGINFLGVTKVSFGAYDATSFTIISPTKILAIAGQVVEGNIPVAVFGPYGEASLPGFYTGPTISSFSPSSGPAGTIVTIQGTHFSSNPLLNIVHFGATKATVVTASANTLQVVVPFGSTFQPLTVTKNNLVATAGKPFVSTFSNVLEDFDVTSFNPNNVLKVGNFPLGVSVADLNDDNKPDVVVCNYASNTISVFKNISKPGLIMFEPKTDITTGDGPFECLLRDINGDGKPDLMVLNSSENSMSILKNESLNGQIIFGLKQNFQTGGNPRSIATEDLNGDGKPDIIVGNSGGGLSFFKNTATPENISLEVVPGVYSGGLVAGVTIADYNNDGSPDISITSGFETIIVLKNTSKYGVISFDEIVMQAGFGTGSIESGDLDGDDLTDIVAINQGNNNFSVYKNVGTNGLISFLPRTSYQTESILSYSVRIGDLNGNGKPDIAVANSNMSNIGLFKNESLLGSLAFDGLQTYHTGFGSTPRSVAIADIDSDGKPDIVSSNSNTRSIVILRNTLTENASLDICPLNLGADLTSNLNGTSYQWQVDDGIGYANIQENGYYSGTTSKVLHISVPPEWYGYKYRCMVDGNLSQPITVHLVNNWIGGSDTEWNNYANWSCGSVPDGNTDVIIKSGTVVVGSNANCRSLKITPGVNFSVSPGVIFTITH